jgi:hypothetical protein
LAVLPAKGAAALEAPVAVRPTWGVLVESLLNPANASAIPSPSLNFNFGCGVIMPFEPGSRFSFEPSADIYYYNAEWRNGQALPTDESFSSAFVLGLLLDAPVVYSLPAGQKFTLGFGAGLCLDLRLAFTTDPANAGNTPLMNGYFWDQARFITPSTLVRGEYALTDRIGFGFTARVLWPIYNLWTGEGFGFFDQGMYLIDLTIRYRLGGGKGASTAVPADEPVAPSPPEAAPPAGATGSSPAPSPPETAPPAGAQPGPPADAPSSAPASN